MIDRSGDPLVKIETFGGNCPVQAEGFVGDQPFYFRARGGHWSMSIGGDDAVSDPDWEHYEEYGDGPFDAGWMPQWQALGFIAKAIGMYVQEETP